MATQSLTLCIVNFQGAQHLPLALAAVRDCQAEFAEILVVDNASTDGCIAWLRNQHPEVRILELASNLGPAGARNAGFRAARHDLILFQDNDIQLQPDCVDILAHTLIHASGALLVAPRVLLASDPEVVQYDSADCHFLGLMMTRNALLPLRDAPMAVAATTSLVTACFIIDRARWRGGPLFDEWFGFNYEDHDFGVRASVLGHDLLVAPAARVLHGSGTVDLSYRAGGAVAAQRVFYLLRNRWSVITKSFALRSLLLLAPILLCYESFQLLGVISKGWTRHWLAAVCSWWRELPRLRRERRELQQARQRGDGEILKCGRLPFTLAVRAGVAQRIAIVCMQGIANTWWRVVRPML
ncbi:MAG: glycosyltransferase [Steroidobacteraceae bacterium]